MSPIDVTMNDQEESEINDKENQEQVASADCQSVRCEIESEGNSCRVDRWKGRLERTQGTTGTTLRLVRPKQERL
ncbi:unnamed protein product [Heligmosomoides polygyrus]|uniref:Uncharacterized protein n=1 Tax=Heligmosomoides polygyrus TaxID=6339 RepID=A0A183GB94_HELPZ|nr:unnamed protein product [Heligmosomoides polygyrus]